MGKSLPSVLLITNEPAAGAAAGQVDGYQLLQRTGEIGRVSDVSAREGFKTNPGETVRRVLEAVDAVKPDITVIWSPGRFPGSRANFERIRQALGSTVLLYWEGDCWHKGKPMTEQMRWWMSASEIVFSTAGPPQVSGFLDAGAAVVHHIPNTYCHVMFQRCEAESPPPINSSSVTMIGSNLMTIPGLSGLPGSLRRVELAVRMKKRIRDFDLRGTGWGSVGLAAEPLPYGLQADHIRSGAASVMWDHYPNLSDYASDRFPIGLIAGRPHVTTRHPGMTWAPGESAGFFQCGSPAEIVETVEGLVADSARSGNLGREAHRWAANRMSHREAARYVMATVVRTVKAPPDDPWGRLPGPWGKGEWAGRRSGRDVSEQQFLDTESVEDT